MIAASFIFFSEQVIYRQKCCFVSSFISDKNVALRRGFVLMAGFYQAICVQSNTNVGFCSNRQVNGMWEFSNMDRPPAHHSSLIDTFLN